MSKLTKRCSKCGKNKPKKLFSKAEGYKGGRKSQCRPCVNEGRRGRRSETPEQKREYRLRYMYGITTEEYESMYSGQDGLCAICGVGLDLLFIDHCHETGRVRGLLCSSCNSALGYFKDNPDTCRAAAEYLE